MDELELKDMIALLKRTDFNPAEIDTDLHKRVADAIQDGYIKRVDMRVNSRDCDQVRNLPDKCDEESGYPKLSLVIHIYYGIS